MHSPSRKFQTMATWATANINERTTGFGTSCFKYEINFLHGSLGE
jgi:hypothetical protein